MRRETLLASVTILAFYIAIFLVWTIVVGGRVLDAVLLLLLGLPIAGLALWWSGRNSRQGP